MNEAICRSIRCSALAAAISCGVALTTTAIADARDGEPLTKVVRYDHLDVNSEPGARTLYGLLRLAGRQVCAPFEGRTLQHIARWDACFEQAIEGAVSKINEPVLTAYHLNQTRKAQTLARVAKEK
jgi:UrcA family protein